METETTRGGSCMDSETTRRGIGVSRVVKKKKKITKNTVKRIKKKTVIVIISPDDIAREFGSSYDACRYLEDEASLRTEFFLDDYTFYEVKKVNVKQTFEFNPASK